MLPDDLKPLKVADLRRILAAANAPPPARATKADLVARVLDSPDAQDAYRALYPPPAPAQPQPPQPEPTPPPPQQQLPEPDAALAPEALELEKRKARAARFGIPLVNTPPADSDKLKARAQRFGTNAAPAPADAEELEKRKKRAERFGTKPPASS